MQPKSLYIVLMDNQVIDIQSVTKEELNLPESIPLETASNEFPVKQFTNLTVKEEKFVMSFIVNNQAKLSAMNAGYPEKSSGSIGCQLLNKPKIINAIDAMRTKFRASMTKEKFVDKALETFEKLDITEPNSPRFYDLAGKALGYIGNNSQSITNNTQINIKADIISMPINTKWDALRSMLEND